MEKGKISALQMAAMMYPTVVATAILSVPSITAQYAKNDLWLSPIFASIIGYVTVYIAYQLFQLYSKQTIIQFSEQIMGRFTGKIIGLLFVFYYIQATGQITRAYAEFMVDAFLAKTPISLIMGMMIFLSVCVAGGGIEVLGRAAQLFFPIFFLPLLLFSLLLFPDFDIKNIFPILEDGVIPPIKGAIVPGAWFTEFFLISFLLPSLSHKEKGMKYGLMMVLFVMITLMIVNLTVLLVLGSTTAYKVYPVMQLARYVTVADFFEHLESVVMAIWVVGAFIKISVFYYVSAVSTAQWLNLSDYRPILWPLGILVVAFGFWSLPNMMELKRYNIEALPPLGLLVHIILPLFLWGVAIVRKRKRKS